MFAPKRGCFAYILTFTGHSGDVYADMLSSNYTVDVKQGKYHGGGRAYKMSSHPRGHVLLINNENFNSEELKARKGTHVDGDKLISLFSQLSFKLYNDKQYTDLTAAVSHSFCLMGF